MTLEQAILEAMRRTRRKRTGDHRSARIAGTFQRFGEALLEVRIFRVAKAHELERWEARTSHRHFDTVAMAWGGPRYPLEELARDLSEQLCELPGFSWTPPDAP